MWFPLATPLKACGSGCKCHVVTSCCFKPWSAGEISQQRHGSFPQFPSIFMTVALAGSVMCMKDSKSDAGEPQPEVSRDPNARARTILDVKLRMGGTP